MTDGHWRLVLYIGIASTPKNRLFHGAFRMSAVGKYTAYIARALTLLAPASLFPYPKKMRARQKSVQGIIRNMHVVRPLSPQNGLESLVQDRQTSFRAGSTSDRAWNSRPSPSPSMRQLTLPGRSSSSGRS